MAEHYDKEVKNMDRKSILNRLDTTLILFELVLSVVFIVLGHLIDNNYIRGVGIGLTIAWVTSAIAYLYKKKMVKP
ncbi:MAG: hypothetical protein ACYDHZ_02585 [Dehalococcoidia bacterium]